MNKIDFLAKDHQYIRVGDDYYRNISKVKANQTVYNKWVKTSRQTIIDDHEKPYLKKIPKFDSFCVVPDHINFKNVIHNNFNNYYPFDHKPKKGSIKWTLRLLNHVFGDQIEIGLDYLQLLYTKPTQILPILCLVSFENQTGKTTFLNWLDFVFKNNMAIIGNQDLQSQFNSSYSTKLIIAVDESKIDKQNVLEKIKALSTAKTINVNNKFITPYTVDFFGKIIMCSNYEDNFISAKNEDVRYWIRKLTIPKFINYNIEEDLQNEVPAFIDFLNKRKLKNEKVSRMWFNPEELFTDALAIIKFNSQEMVIKKMMEFLTDRFDESGANELFATPTDIERIIFKNNSRIDSSYIRRILTSKFKLTNSDKIKRYSPLEQIEYDSYTKIEGKITKTGRPFCYKREIFYINGDILDKNKTPKTNNSENNENTVVVDNQNDEPPF